MYPKEATKKTQYGRDYALAGAVGALSGGLRGATGALSDEFIERKAHELEQKRRERLRVMGKEKSIKLPEEKLVGAGFWIMIGVAMFKDIIDIFLGLSLILSFLIVLTTIVINFVVFFYLFYNDVEITNKKVASWVSTFILEVIPLGLFFLPLTTLNLIIIRTLEHNERIKKFATASHGKLSA